MRLGIQQRLLPHFRAPLYDAIAGKNNGPVEVFSGLPQPEEGIQRADGLRHAKWRITHNRCFTVGSQKAYWQEQFGHWLDEFKPDVLAVESNPRILSNYPGFRRARSLGIPIVGWGIGVMGDAKDRGLYGAFMRRYFRQVEWWSGIETLPPNKTMSGTRLLVPTCLFTCRTGSSLTSCSPVFGTYWNQASCIV